jgi:hypothetical protein
MRESLPPSTLKRVKKSDKDDESPGLNLTANENSSGPNKPRASTTEAIFANDKSTTTATSV